MITPVYILISKRYPYEPLKVQQINQATKNFTRSFTKFNTDPDLMKLVQ